MKKEEILARNRKDNQKLDEREKIIELKANKCAALVGTAFCFIIIILEFIFANTTILTFLSFSTLYLTLSIESWFLAIKLKNKKIYFHATLQTIVFVFCFSIVLYTLLITSILQL